MDDLKASTIVMLFTPKNSVSYEVILMPLNCPRGFTEYDACLECGNKHGDECWIFTPAPVVEKLSNILTIPERIAILEDRPKVPEVNIVTITKEDFQQLQRLILRLQDQLNKHLDIKPKRKYKVEC